MLCTSHKDETGRAEVRVRWIASGAVYLSEVWSSCQQLPGPSWGAPAAAAASYSELPPVAPVESQRAETHTHAPTHTHSPAVCGVVHIPVDSPCGRRRQFQSSRILKLNLATERGKVTYIWLHPSWFDLMLITSQCWNFNTLTSRNGNW